MIEIKIRPYAPDDLEECRILWEELTQHHREIYGDPSIGGDNPGLYFDKHLADVGADRIWVAELSGDIVGMTGLIMKEQEAEIEPLIVSPEYRSQGIGKALVTRAIQEAQTLGVSYVSVRPVARNTHALSFFHKCGFQILGHIDLFMDLSTSGKWKEGLSLFENDFKY
ncbi:MAG: GNAT family N-acetyltransferase [Theionarchaea archaeon]|nr:GNAT family N-acetyltransferase [Theionarchaea archaeon]MBU7039130.1 GNAT family N-acetyltransferase [Theionarchaea archaeon]